MMLLITTTKDANKHLIAIERTHKGATINQDKLPKGVMVDGDVDEIRDYVLDCARHPTVRAPMEMSGYDVRVLGR